MMAWLLASMVVFNVICAFIIADHGAGYKPTERDLAALTALSLLWPLGVVFIVIIAGQHWRERA